jgi:hypothetical protein
MPGVSDSLSAMFDPRPSARADLRPGTLYAVIGEGGWIYYGQVMPNRCIGFLQRRDREPAAPEAILAEQVMAKIGVVEPSIGRALRAGRWKRLGCFPLHRDLERPHPLVQWPVGTLTVTVGDGEREYDTRVEDPAIQHYEIIAAWDAEYHIPERLTADYGAERAAWHVGGPIWRERRTREEYASRFPDAHWHTLPPDWVPTG